MVSYRFTYSHPVFYPLATGLGSEVDDIEDLEETLYGVLNVMESPRSKLFPG
jgi:hypothetical protein